MKNKHLTNVTTWCDFQKRWDGVLNFLMAEACVPFAYDMPPLERVVDELRQDPEVHIGSGKPGQKLELEEDAEKFKKLTVPQALNTPFSMAHYHLSRFDSPNRCLEGFGSQVLDRWKNALREHGFTWDRCYPIIFISGRHCATNYHVDFSHVLAWQIYGTKRFCGLKDPARWISKEMRLNYKPGELQKPASLTEDDALCYTMTPGDVLWNTYLTPHWVNASDEVAMSINLSHGGLRFNGQLCPWEQQLEDYRQAHPTEAPAAFQGRY